jgi:hypothetical protein
MCATASTLSVFQRRRLDGESMSNDRRAPDTPGSRRTDRTSARKKPCGSEVNCFAGRSTKYSRATTCTPKVHRRARCEHARLCSEIPCYWKTTTSRGRPLRSPWGSSGGGRYNLLVSGLRLCEALNSLGSFSNTARQLIRPPPLLGAPRSDWLTEALRHPATAASLASSSRSRRRSDSLARIS